MYEAPVPFDKLLLFTEKIGLGPEALAVLAPYRSLLASRKDDFSRFFYQAFQEIPEAALVIEYEERPGRLVAIWSHWFESLFSSEIDRPFLSYLWRIGMRHVSVNLDQRFSNLGFTLIRQFCHEIVNSDIPAEARAAVMQTIDRLIDFCLLVETSAYIEATTRCDIEIIKGIADRVRNPVAFIGGSIRRLQKTAGQANSAPEVYDALIAENRRLEHMVIDVKTYFEIFEAEPVIESLLLQEALDRILLSADLQPLMQKIPVSLDIGADAEAVRADRRDFDALLLHVLQNSLEAAPPSDGRVSVRSRRVAGPHPGVRIEFFNAGQPISLEKLDRMSSPFYSTKTTGTGFGIPIIRLILRKNYGKITFQPVPGEGTNVIVTLPAPPPGS